MEGITARQRLQPATSLSTAHCIVLVSIVAMFTAGCAGTHSKQAKARINNELVARDLLYVMAQLREPDTTTFQLGHPATDFGRELEKGFREIGYGMQRVSADHGPNFMTYSESTNVSSTSQSTFRYKVFIGDIGLERNYTDLAEVGMVPTGPMIVYGSNKEVLLSDLIFPGQSLEVAYRENEEAVVEDTSITVFDTSVIGAVTELRKKELPQYKTFNNKQNEIKNLFTRGSSNFESLGRDYRVVRKEVIAFPDDSLFLLDKGRSQVQNIVKFYRAETDLVRVVGCSNGPTQYKGGNIALAQGRSARIAQELVKRNVKENTILDEGCWSPQSAGDRFPARGVIVELQRKS